MFPKAFVYQKSRAVTLEKDEFLRSKYPVYLAMLGTVNNLYVNRIAVSPRDRRKFLLPFVHLCYDH